MQSQNTTVMQSTLKNQFDFLMENHVPVMQEHVPLMEEQQQFPLMEEKQNYYVHLFEQDSVFRWKLIHQSTRTYGPQKIQLIDNTIILNDRPLHSLMDFMLAVKQTYDHNQLDITTTLMSFVESIPFFKDIATNHRVQAISAFVSLLAHIYALAKCYDDPIMWVTQLAGITGVILSLISLIQTVAIRDIIPSGLVDEEIIDPIKICSDAITLYTTARFEKKGKLHHSCLAYHLLQGDKTSAGLAEDPIQYFGQIKGEGWDTFLEHVHESFDSVNLTIHDPEGDYTFVDTKGFTFKGPMLDAGEFAGCVVPTTAGFQYYPSDKNQSLAQIIDSPLLSGFIGILYAGALLILTKVGFTSAKEFLEFARVKDSVLKSVKDTRSFMKFVSEDVLNITESSTEKMYQALSMRHTRNSHLLDKQITWFCEDPSNYYLIQEAIQDSMDLISGVKTDNESRTSVTTILGLLQSSITALRDLKRKVKERIRTMDGRPDVVVLHLWGEGGVGKTEMTKKILIPLIAQKLGISPAAYSINLPQNGHWPTYAGQKIAIYDEYGSRGVDDPIIEHFNGLCSSGYFSMTGAHLEEKPQPCAIRVLICISNQPRWNLTKKLMASVVPAFWSRHQTYKVDWPGYTASQRQTKIGRRPDFQHLKFYRQEFANEDNKFEPMLSTECTYEAIVEGVVAKYRQHELQHAKDHIPCKNEMNPSGPLVFNITGQRGVGKTWTFKGGLIPRLKNFTNLPCFYYNDIDDMTVSNTRAIYVLDDIVVSNSSQQVLQRYVAFYNKVASGSIIFLLSNMVFPRKLTLSSVGWLPVKSQYCKLDGEYYENDAIIRRLGLEGWIYNKSGYYHEDRVDIEYVMRESMMWRGKESFTMSTFLDKIIIAYQSYVNTLRDYTLLETSDISEVGLENYLQFRDMTIEELSTAVKNGGLPILKAIREKKIIIPKIIFDRFDPSYPVQNFIFSTDPEVLLVQIPKLMTTLRNSCVDAEVFISCGAFKLRTDRQIIYYSQPSEHSTQTIVDMCTNGSEELIRVRTTGNGETLIDYIPAIDCFNWMNGDVSSLPLAHLNTRDFELIKNTFKNTTSYARLQVKHLDTVRRVERERLKAKWIPRIMEFLDKVPVIKIVLGVCVLSTSVVIINQVCKLFSPADKNQKGKKGKTNSSNTASYGWKGGSDPHPDFTHEKYETSPGSNKNLEYISKDTADLVKYDRYEEDVAAWQERNPGRNQEKEGHDQMFRTPINNNEAAFDQVLRAVHEAAVMLTSPCGSLVGHMIYKNVGVSNAHFVASNYISRANTEKELKKFIDGFVFDVLHEEDWYHGRVIRYCPLMDLMLFEIIEKTFPMKKDIRSLFLTHDKAQPHQNYEGCLVKYRSQGHVVEKCNIDYSVNSAIYYSSQCETGVLSHGVSPTFVTSEQGIETKDGDCGSFYILAGKVPSQDQHCRIIGMHVGLRRNQFPHGTTFPRSVLYGTREEKQVKNQSLQQLASISDPLYKQEGQEMLCDYLQTVVQRSTPLEHPFDTTTIEVIGHDKTFYVKPLQAGRTPTKNEDLVTEVFGMNSGMLPTATNYKNMDLSNAIVVNGRPDILSTQFAPYGETLGTFDQPILNDVAEFVESRYKSIYKTDTTILSFDIAVNGHPEGHPLYGKMNRLNLDASAGPYFKEKYGITKKKEFFKLEGDKWVLRDTPAAANFKERSLFILDHLLNGIAYQTLTQVCLKSELRPTEKVEKGIIRTFDNTDASVVMAHRMLLMNSIIAFQDPTSRMRGGPQIGQNALLDFPGYIERFQGKQLLQFDFTQYDRRLHPEVIKKAYFIVLRMQGYDKEKAAKISNALMLQTSYSFKMVGNTLCRTHQGISSGMLFTSLGDSICNELMMYYCICKGSNVTPRWVSMNFDPIDLGDDITIGITKEGVEHLNLLPNMIEEYRKIGMVVTSADKVSEIAFEPLSAFAFCSRTARKTRTGVVVCPLKQRTILALFEWVSEIERGEVVNINGKPTMWTTNHQIVTQINEALMEASMHNATQFKLYLKLAKKIAARMRTKQIPQAIIDDIDLRTHLQRETYTENLISGRKSLNNSLKSITKSDRLQINMSTTQEKQSIILVEEWCNHFKIAKPEVMRHTSPEPLQGILSKCILRTTWAGKTCEYQGVGVNKKESKRKAFDLLLEENHITPLLSHDTLTEFCKQNMKIHDVSELRSFRDGSFVVFIIDKTAKIHVMGRDASSSTAVYNARKEYYQRYQTYANSLIDNEEIDSPDETCIIELEAPSWDAKVSECVNKLEEECLKQIAKDDNNQMRRRHERNVTFGEEVEEPTRQTIATYQQYIKLPSTRYAGRKIPTEKEYYAQMRGKTDRDMLRKEESMKRIAKDDNNQMEANNSAGVGMTMHAQSASAPPAPNAITPAAGALPEPQAEPTALVNLPVGLMELENINQPPLDMLTFGGVDFTIFDLAYRQCIDHVADKPINQNVPRGTVLLVQSYDPTKLNAYIQSLCAQHTRYTGPLCFRLHVVGNPIFMGEIAWAWVKDVRNIREGQILSDLEYQKYLWVTFDVKNSWTKHFALADARKQGFYREMDTELEDQTEMRPGFVMVMYRAVVNPFNNPEAACFFNVGSYLAQTFRFSDPQLQSSTLRPDGVQTDSVNSIVGRTVGTVFSEYGLIDSPTLFMATDGNQYPVIDTPLDIDTTTNVWNKPTVSYPRQGPYINGSNSSRAYRAMISQRAVTESEINNAYPVSDILIKQYATDHKTMILVGDVPAAIYDGGNQTTSLSYCLAAASMAQVASRMLSAGSGVDSVTVTTDAVTVDYYTTSITSPTTASSIGSISFSWDNNRCVIYFFLSEFYPTLVNRGIIYLRESNNTKGVVMTSNGNVFQYSLTDNQKTLRFGTESFPVYTGLFDKPTSPSTPAERRFMEYFKTLTSGTNGFVQFGLFDPDRALLVATVRFDVEVGFTIRALNEFAQYNGRSIAALVFTDVRFGDRTTITRETDTSSWLQRQGNVVLVASVIKETVAPMLYGYKFGDIVSDTAKATRKEMFALKKELATMNKVLLTITSNDKNQAAAMFALSAAAGGMQGIGSGVGNWLTMKQQSKENQLDRDLNWNSSLLTDKRQREMQEGNFSHNLQMQGNSQTHDQRMSNLRAQLERESYSTNRDTDMRVKLATAGAIAPVAQQAQTRHVNLASNSSYGGSSYA
jgi:hypothetical protein